MNVLTNTSCRVVKDVLKRLQSSSATASSFDINIPNRIERGSTDILKALEQTISRDPSAAAYIYHDDPYLIPISKQEQRFRRLTLESGRKAAMWIYEEHGDLFARELADPVIPEFLPRVTYTRKDQVSEEVLLNTISQGKTLEALKIYDLLDENVSIKAKQSLLELLCFSNSQDLPQFEFKDTQWYTMDSTKKKTCVWNETKEIKKLSTFLMSQDDATVAAAYNALICGMAKFLQINQAWSLYIKCSEDKIPLNVYAYNAIIRIVPLLKGPLQEPLQEVYKLLYEMNTNGICPNIGTLNAALETLRSFSYCNVTDNIHRLLAEFKAAGVKPSLASYYHILVVTKRNSDSVNSLLSNMLSVLENENPRFCDPDDVHFFPFAMDIAMRQSNREMGERVHALLLKGDNSRFIKNAFSESIYYRQYVLLNLKTLPIEEFFKLYYNLTMNIYIPEALIFQTIFPTLQLQSDDVKFEHLPKLWCQIQMFNMFDVEGVIEVALDITCRCNLEPESQLHQTFAKYAWDIWQNKQSKISNIRQSLGNAKDLGNIMILLLRAFWCDEALEIISTMVHKEMFIMGALDTKQVDELLEICILHGYGPIAINLVKCAMIFDLQDAAMMARKVYNAIPLNAAEKEELISLVGNDVLQLQLPDER